jgi:chromosome segregation ATPase
MPQQAILDLPIIEFEAFRGSHQSLHAHCVDAYGINGLAPHPDAAFHFGASLWRYREAESPKQVAGLAASYLVALSDHVAARRRLSAARSSTRSIKRIRDAEEEVEDAAYHLDEVMRVVAEFVGDMLESASHEPSRARRRLESNIEAMADRAWAAEMEQAAQGFVAGKPRVRWTDTLIDVLDALEATPLPVHKHNAPKRGAELEGRVIEQLQAELDEYRRLANTASARLQQVDSERHELEQILTATQAESTQRSLELEEARRVLEQSLSQAKHRLERLEKEVGPGLREELQRARLERDRLAEELLQALDTATESDVAREEMLDLVEHASNDRVQAADAISGLSTRLDAVQKDAESTAERAEAYRQRMNELEDDRDALRAELRQTEQQHSEAQARIKALENAQDQSAEIEKALADAEARVADAENRHEDTRGKLDSLTSEFEDLLSDLEETRDKLQKVDNELETIRKRHAETAAESEKHKTNAAAARSAESALKEQVRQLNERVAAEQKKTAAALRDKERADRSVADVQGDLNALRELRSQLTEQLKTLEDTANKATQSLKQRDKDTGRLQGELDRAEQRIKDLEAALQQAQTDLQSAALQAGGAESEHASRVQAETELANTRSELASLQAERVAARQQIAELREGRQATADLTDERRRVAEEKLSLMQERAQRLENETRLLSDALAKHERNRAGEKGELDRVAEKAARDLAAAREKLQTVQLEAYQTQEQLNETESFLIARQRDLEKAEKRVKGIFEAIGAVADLRTDYEKTSDEKKRGLIASQISRRLDALFSEAGRPVHADRKTERILVLHVKKGDDELESESEKPFVATKRRRNSKGGSASARGDE